MSSIPSSHAASCRISRRPWSGEPGRTSCPSERSGCFSPKKEGGEHRPRSGLGSDGKLPEEHGITDFIVRDGDITFPITSNYLMAAPVWEILGERGRKVALVGWWASCRRSR